MIIAKAAEAYAQAKEDKEKVVAKSPRPRTLKKLAEIAGVSGCATTRLLTFPKGKPRTMNQ